MSALPDFFQGRTDPWRFADVLAFIRRHFEVVAPFSFRVGKKLNRAGENQRAGIVFAYAQLINYTLNQVKALFAEHDHFAIALPESRRGRNILELNRCYAELLQKGYPADIRMSQVPGLFEIPPHVLVPKHHQDQPQ